MTTVTRSRDSGHTLDGLYVGSLYVGSLYVGSLTKKVNQVLDGNTSSFFDGLDHEWLIKFIEHRIANQMALCSFRFDVVHHWYRTLRRPSQKKRLTREPMRSAGSAEEVVVEVIPTPTE